MRRFLGALRVRFGAESTRALEFWEVESRERVLALQRRGELVRVLLLPLELGGTDAEENATYVPPDVAAVKDRLGATLRRYFAEGRVDRLSVEPRFKGGSLVPANIRVRAWNSQRIGEFTTVIEIW